MRNLDHNRWQLRLADDWKREAGRRSQAVVEIVSLDRYVWCGAEFQTSAAGVMHFEKLCELPPAQQEAACAVVKAFGVYQGQLSSGASDKAKRAAHDGMTAAGKPLAALMLRDFQDGTSGFWQWFSIFHGHLEQRSQRRWHVFGETILERCLPWALADMVANSPEQAARLVKLMTR